MTSRPAAPPPVPSAFVAFDCETTGLDAGRDAIVQLAAVAVSPEGRREWSTLVDPGRPLPLQVARLTGLTAERLRGAPPPAAALREFRAFVGGLPLVAHNARFDRDFIEAGLARHRLPPLGGPVFDTLEMARLLAPAAPSYRLADLAAARGLALEQAHDALDDARAAAELFAALLGDLQAMPPRLQRTIAHFLARQRGPLAAVVTGLAGGGLPELVRLPLAPVAARERAERLASAAAPPDLQGALQPGSPLARRLPRFEVRAGQARMLDAVSQAFATDRHLIVEAGTGTGKSLAYLLPALAWALAQGQRVVVATHTVNLQEQLVDRDLPLLFDSGVVAGEVALVKGRAQYACLKLWEERLQPGAEADPAEAGFLARFAAWLAATTTGDRGELRLYGQDEERFSALSADAVACTGRACRHHEGCFLFRARRKAERADVIVANHALLFSDLGTGGGVLPEYAYLVCDEAHHLEDQASNHLGRVVGERGIERFWRLLDRGGGIGRAGGALGELQELLAPAPLAGAVPGGAAQGRAAQRLEQALSAVRSGREGAAAYFDALRAWAAARGAAGGSARATARCEPRPEAGADPAWDAVRTGGGDLAEALRRLGEALESLAASLEDGAPEADGAGLPAERVQELRALAGRAGESSADVWLCLDGRPGWVTWAEVAQTRAPGRAGAVVVRACPIDPGEILERELFARKRSVIMTSATLSVRGRFDYFRSRMGLAEAEEAERTDELLVPSPFDFRRQALLGVPTDLPRPSPQGVRAYARAVAPLLLRLLRASRGHALVLFTSNRTMRELRDVLRPELEADGIACLAQGIDGSRTALASELRRNEQTVVLGSASFWEGVDVPGEALRCLVICQLPFWPPDMPLQQARQEQIAERGGSGFRDLQLPQAVLRFKQGFGRLIRGATDTGVAVVLDPRLATADYGRVFLASLPRPDIHVGPAADVVERAIDWLGQP